MSQQFWVVLSCALLFSEKVTLKITVYPPVMCCVVRAPIAWPIDGSLWTWNSWCSQRFANFSWSIIENLVFKCQIWSVYKKDMRRARILVVDRPRVWRFPILCICLIIEPDVSPIGSPVKQQSGESRSRNSNSDMSIKVLADNTNVTSSSTTTSTTSTTAAASPVIRASTPNSKSAVSKRGGSSGSKGLSHRDTNSPLSIIQRKQTNKINNHITVKSVAVRSAEQSRSGSSSFCVATDDKENQVSE